MREPDNRISDNQEEWDAQFESALAQLTLVIGDATEHDDETGLTLIALHDGWEVQIAEEGGAHIFQGADPTALLRAAAEYLQRKFDIPEQVWHKESQVAVPKVGSRLRALRLAAIERHHELAITYSVPDSDDEEPWEMIWQGVDELVVCRDTLEQLVQDSLAIVTLT